MTRVYILLYDNSFVRHELRTLLDTAPEVLDWRYDTPNCFYLISRESAERLAKIIESQRKTEKSRFLVEEVGSNRQGWLAADTWDFLNLKSMQQSERTEISEPTDEIGMKRNPSGRYESIEAHLEAVKRENLDWDNTTGSARKWWLAFEAENQHRKPIILRLARELSDRNATITEFFLAYVYSNTDNILANLHYLDYVRLKNQEQARKNQEDSASKAPGTGASDGSTQVSAAQSRGAKAE